MMASAFLRERRGLVVVVAALAMAAGGWWWRTADVASASAPPPAATKEAGSDAAIRPSLTVTTVVPRQEDWPLTLSVDGNVTAWQEAVIGAELGQYRIAEVNVQVGDRVSKGQVLARIDEDAVASELAESRAAVAELEAFAAEAKVNADRAETLRTQGFYSSQTGAQYVTAERTSGARVAGARARLQAAELRMSKTHVTAPDDGVISARTATVGSLTQPGQELFRLIRGGRLEWQAEIPANDLMHVKSGVAAWLSGPGGKQIVGKVRSVAPSVDPRTRNGIVYVDLPPQSASGLRAGMFARGEIETGGAPALTLPQATVVLREGFAYVFGIVAGKAGEQARVEQIRVKTGRRKGERIEILEGVKPAMSVVESGAGFLADGDIVSIVAGAAEGSAP